MTFEFLTYIGAFFVRTPVDYLVWYIVNVGLQRKLTLALEFFEKRDTLVVVKALYSLSYLDDDIICLFKRTDIAKK